MKKSIKNRCQHLNPSESALPNDPCFLYIKSPFVFTVTVVGTGVTVITKQYNMTLIGSMPVLCITQYIVLSFIKQINHHQCCFVLGFLFLFLNKT